MGACTVLPPLGTSASRYHCCVHTCRSGRSSHGQQRCHVPPSPPTFWNTATAHFLEHCQRAFKAVVGRDNMGDYTLNGYKFNCKTQVCSICRGNVISEDHFARVQAFRLVGRGKRKRPRPYDDHSAEVGGQRMVPPPYVASPVFRATPVLRESR